MDIKKYDDWRKVNETNELNEFFGVGKLFKSLWGSLTGPVKKNIEILTKNIDTKTGKISDAKVLKNQLIKTFQEIAKDKKADIKGVEDIETLKDILKEFFNEIRATFTAARIPFMTLTESDNFGTGSFEFEINEKQKKRRDKRAEEQAAEKVKNLNLTDIMKKTEPETFDEEIDGFIFNWIKKNGGKQDIQQAEKASIDLIDKMVKKFEEKIKAFSPSRLEKLTKLITKDPEPKDEEVQKIMDAPEEKETADDGTEVKTIEGKEQFIDAIEDNIEDLEFHKIDNKDGTFNLVIKGIEL